MAANDMQVGGTHYRASVQHWDVVDDYNVGYLEACATKYLTRWRSKDGVRDLRKAAHYVAKLLEKRLSASPEVLAQCTPRVPLDVISDYLQANRLTGDEADTVQALFSWGSTSTLQLVAGRLAVMIQKAEADSGEPGPGYVNQDR